VCVWCAYGVGIGVRMRVRMVWVCLHACVCVVMCAALQPLVSCLCVCESSRTLELSHARAHIHAHTLSLYSSDSLHSASVAPARACPPLLVSASPGMEERSVAVACRIKLDATFQSAPSLSVQQGDQSSSRRRARHPRTSFQTSRHGNQVTSTSPIRVGKAGGNGL
jgi:hypothetical protein